MTKVFLEYTDLKYFMNIDLDSLVPIIWTLSFFHMTYYGPLYHYLPCILLERHEHIHNTTLVKISFSLSRRSSRGTRTPNCVPYNFNRVFRSGVQSFASGLSQVAAICDRLRGSRYKPHRLYKNTEPHIFFLCVYRVSSTFQAKRFYNFKFEYQFLFCSQNIRYVPLETYTTWSV